MFKFINFYLNFNFKNTMDKRLKKLIAGATSVALVASQTLIGFAYGAAYPQVVQDAFNWAKQNGMTKANSIDEFEPYAQLSRGTAAKLFAIFGKDVLGLQPDVTRSCNFSDIDGKWYAKYAVEACQLGLMKGDNGKFYGDRKLFKSEAVVVLARALAGKTLEWNEAITYAQEKGITHETDVTKLYRPVLKWELVIMEKRVADQKQATQQTQEQNQQEENADKQEENADIGNLLNNLLNEGQEEQQEKQSNEQTTSEENQQEQQTEEQGQTEEQSQEEEQGQTEEQEEQQTVEGNVLEVALDPDTPRESYVPGTGSHIKVMKLDLTAGSEDVEVKAITVKLDGMVSREHITNVYIEDENGKVLTNQREFNTDYEARLVFDGDYVVPANTVKKVYVVMDVKNSVNEIIKFVIPSADYVDASTEVKGDFPIESAPIHTTSYSSEVLTFDAERSNAVTDPKNADETLYVGDKNKRIMKFELTAGDENKRDIILKSIRLRGVQSIEDKIDNIKLVVGGQNIAKDVIVDGKYVTIIVDDFVIPYGNTKTFYVYADVVGGEKNDIVQLYLDEDTDISALEDETNAAVAIKVEKRYGKSYKIEEGDNLITKSSESPTSQYIPNDEDNITVLVANVNISNPMDVDKIRVFFTGTNVSKDIKRVKLYINDKYIDEDSTFSTGCDGHSDMACAEFSYYDVLKGSNKFIVKIDTETDADDNDVVKDFTIDEYSIAW